MANLVAHHATPPPMAMLSVTGIATFRHPFFNSATLLTTEPVTAEEMAPYLQGPVEAGMDTAGFALEMLLPSGEKNSDYEPPAPAVSSSEDASVKYPRGCLYDYYLYNNGFLEMVGGVDPGFEWAKKESEGERLKNWPTTVFIQGDSDPDVAPGVTTETVGYLGPDKAKLHMAVGEDHLFEQLSFLEDEGPSMDVVRDALKSLDAAVSG